MRLLPLAALLALAGCGGTPESAPGTTADETRQLDEAAAATDINVALTDNAADTDSDAR
ncbi:hypothetical protein [Sphingomonas hengshuiensis]|uniref:hypothetical protein n=1 Tax=Sphingomonas hengshuiensis TaxID=1609977 RepID=UPI000A5CFC72|nr:hypothetical protein [Sphingomonas hengshuiensis]